MLRCPAEKQSCVRPNLADLCMSIGNNIYQPAQPSSEGADDKKETADEGEKEKDVEGKKEK